MWKVMPYSTIAIDHAVVVLTDVKGNMNCGCLNVKAIDKGDKLNSEGPFTQAIFAAMSTATFSF